MGYSNSPSQLTAQGAVCGAVRVVVSVGDVTGNGGTSLPCRGCYVAEGFLSTGAASTGFVKMNIGAAATSMLGVVIPRPPKINTFIVAVSEATMATPMWVPVDDVDQLHFCGGVDGDIVDILYFK